MKSRDVYVRVYNCNNNSLLFEMEFDDIDILRNRNIGVISRAIKLREWNIEWKSHVFIKQLKIQFVCMKIRGTNAWIIWLKIRWMSLILFFVLSRVAIKDNVHITVNVQLPNILVEGKYDVEGKLLLLPISGSGPVHGNFTNCLGIYHRFCKQQNFLNFCDVEYVSASTFI